jgi:hypothetical protein
MPNWIKCPVCDEPDMLCEKNAQGDELIHCVNLACPANRERLLAPCELKFEDLAAVSLLLERYPEHADLIARVGRFLARHRAAQSLSADRLTLPIRQIAAELAPLSRMLLAEVLATLVDQGFLKKVIKLSSNEYSSFTEVPAVVLDERSGRESVVLLDDLQMLFFVPHR